MDTFKKITLMARSWACDTDSHGFCDGTDGKGKSCSCSCHR